MLFMSQTAPKKLKLLDRYLTLWIFLAMGLGVGVGDLFPGVPSVIESMGRGGTNIPLDIGYHDARNEVQHLGECRAGETFE
jgi:ACR3 family arsenite efflux pump ArsB